MLNQKELEKNALTQALKTLENHEPKCICEQCEYGYYFEEEHQDIIKKKCSQQKERIEREHKIWEVKKSIWELRIKLVERELELDALRTSLTYTL